MIGVIASPAEHAVVREFFELFKTPWEFYCQDRKYDVLLCAGDGQFEATAEVVLVYAGRRINFDNQRHKQSGREWKDPCTLSFHGNQIPIYGDTITFPAQAHGLLTREDSKECVAYFGEEEGRVVARIGYDLFAEIHSLLTVGQPASNASLPALELHIELLRNLVTGCGIPLVEIPPIPDGFQFIACLTHDVDHPSIRQHKWDHTMFGFLYRAIFGSLRRLLHGQISFQGLLTNWTAALQLPFVHLGLAKDFWREFDDRYLELEKDLRSTFFVIPFSNRAGSGSDGPAPLLRATRYRARDLADTIRKLTAAGCEVGLHGIDGWLDSSKGQQELDEIRSLTGATQIGVRMHWLYYDQQSPLALEAAGAAYDSTVGYNDTVGYRAGTTQVFKPLDATRLLELPLHVMDTALFYPSYRNLSPQQAKKQVCQMADNAAHFGGTLTINWHDRSMAPERLWGACYRDLIQDLQNRGVWFSTAGQAVSWFRKRRSASFESDEPGAIRVKVAVEDGDNLPGLRRRIHKGWNLGLLGTQWAGDYVDTPVGESMEARIPSEAER
jgi:hypothetical protein